MRFTYWFWTLLLLFHTACNGCKKYEIVHEEDRWGAAVDIDGVDFLGSINGYPVLELRGTISKNIPGIETPFLCALMVPRGETPDAGAIAIQGHKIAKSAQDASSNSLSMGKLHQLPGGSFVQYERSLNPDETGAVAFSVASLDPDHSLALGTTYHIYLGIKVGPHFFYAASVHADYALPDASSLTQITMTSANCKHNRDASGKIFPGLSAGATVTNSPNSGNAGFLFLKQGANLTPAGVLAKQLQAGSTPLPTIPNTFVADPDRSVVICPTATGGTLTINDLQDTTGVLEKGATYDVYGYIEEGTNYYVSLNGHSITLPEVETVEITVAMGSVEDPALTATKQSSNTDTEYDVSEFNLAVSGRIERLENASNPVAGFVFVQEGQATDKAHICQAITGSISNTSALGNVIDVNNNKGYVVCIAQTHNVDAVQTITYTYNLQNGTGSYLDLTRHYAVYFWVKDAQGDGKLFLSDDSQALEVFYVKGAGITHVTGSHQGNALSIRLNVDNDLLNAQGADMKAVFLENNREILLRDVPCAAGRRTIDVKATNGADLTAQTQYQLALRVKQGGVCYTIYGQSPYTTPAFLQQSRPNTIVDLPSGRSIELDLENGVAYSLDPRDPRRVRTRLDATRDKALIIEAINLYSSQPTDRARCHNEFGVGVGT
ncbi:MAG TPA: hypothetical protein DCQ08_00595 [Amoebophilaceae bacterium]|nr:hypothetical protein [Amoebophilaceae bacterium]